MVKNLLITLLFLTNLGCQVSNQTENTSNYYQEKHRPQFHFSPEANWMNDPNGMFFYEGEYHLFYQYYPDSNVWGPMHWGHAVSKDMIKWEHLPIALYPDSLGYIFSGSAVVDWNNTSGLGTEQNPPIVAIYTYHDPEGEKAGTNDFQTQGIAYSLDKGRSWTKYDQNPVLPNPGIRDFRDPKVIWYEPNNKWIMTLAVQDHVSFYSSTDLKSWTFESDFGKEWGSHGGVWECPDLFPMQVDGSENNKWVLLLSINPGGPRGGSATQYFIGDFDGSVFQLDEGFSQDVASKDDAIGERAVWLDYGADNYAGVTWSDIPEEDGRRLFIGWMSNWQYAQIVPTTIWRSAMTLPRELTLTKVDNSYRLKSKPVGEIEDYLGPVTDLKDSVKETSYVIRASLSGEFEIKLGNSVEESLIIKVMNVGVAGTDTIIPSLIFDRTNSGITDFHDQFGAQHIVPLNDVIPESIEIYVDASSVEIFINEGELVMTELIFPNEPFDQIESSGGVQDLTYSPIRSIWD